MLNATSYACRMLKLWSISSLSMLLAAVACGDAEESAARDGGAGAAAAGGQGAQGAGNPAGGAGGGVAAPEGWAPLAWEDCEGGGRVLSADPSDYRAILDTLKPGDVLQLSAGQYDRGLPVRVSGEPGSCIVIEAAPGQARPLIMGSSSFNLVSFRDVSWVKVRGLEVDGDGKAGFGVSGEGSGEHHIVIEDMVFYGLAASQQIVAISTKSPCTDWVIRGNRISDAGTGMYLGNSDGSKPFVRGLIEFNEVLDTIGYNMQIKHQNSRPNAPGLPSEPSETIIRYNVFSKQNNAATGSARPNFLLGHFPLTGVGSDDGYRVYGNFFYDNPTENLVQAEGHVAFYANVLLNPSGGGAVFQKHNGEVRNIDVLLNTVVTTGTPIRLSGGQAGYTQQVRYNAVFSDSGISAAGASDNYEGSRADASSLLAKADAALGKGLDLHPLEGSLSASFDPSALGSYPGIDLDFDGKKRSGKRAGAYLGPAASGAWPLARAMRPYGP